MKNFIKYYYGLDVSHIVQKEEVYFFIINNKYYIFLSCDVNDLTSILKYIGNDLKFHELVLTKDNSSFVILNNNTYSLFKIVLTPLVNSFTPLFNVFTLLFIVPKFIVQV